ncbi:hypothetical protein MIMGU_mgv1a025614mg, partial [Erythranthe guttata]
RVQKVNRLAAAEAQRLQDALEEEHVAGDPEHALLLVAVLRRGFVQQLHKNRVVQQLGADDEPLHLVSDVHRQVSLRHAAGPLPEGLRSVCQPGMRSEQAVLRGIGNSGEFPHQLLHVI